MDHQRDVVFFIQQQEVIRCKTSVKRQKIAPQMVGDTTKNLTSRPRFAERRCRRAFLQRPAISSNLTSIAVSSSVGMPHRSILGQYLEVPAFHTTRKWQDHDPFAKNRTRRDPLTGEKTTVKTTKSAPEGALEVSLVAGVGFAPTTFRL